MNRISSVLVVTLSLTGCSSKKEGDAGLDPAKAKHLAQLCVEASGALGQKMDDETYRKTMATVMGACAEACTANEASACAMLDKQVGILCGVSSEVCSQLCDPSHPGALSDAACKAQKASVGSGSAAPAAIKRYVAADGAFAVQPLVAGEPTEKDLPDPNGGSWRSFSWTSGKQYYAVQSRTYPSAAHAVAETAGFIPTRDKASISLDKEVRVGAYKGRDIVWAERGNTLTARFLIDGSRVWKVVAGGKVDANDAKKFIGSLELHPNPALANAIDLDSKDILARPASTEGVEIKHVLIAWDALDEASYKGELDARAKRRSNADAATLAKEIEAKLRANPATIDTLAKEHTNEPLPHSDRIGVQPDANVIPSFKNLALRLNENEVGIVATPFGYHVMLRIPKA